MVVDAVDEVVLRPGGFGSMPVAVDDAGDVCFEAHVTGASEPSTVAGLTWAFTVDGPATSRPSLARNCVSLSLTGEGTVTVDATAVGVSAQTSFVVGAAARRAPTTAGPRGPRGARPTAGERAATVE
ncbi:MAG: hypothetical protein R2939_06640 [Kofleriaceae bacterium]